MYKRQVVATASGTATNLNIMTQAYQLTSGATTFYEDFNSTTGTGTSATTTQAATLGDLVVFGQVHLGNNASTPGGGLTERSDRTAAANIGSAAGDLIADATSESPSSSWTGSYDYAAIGATIISGADDASVPVVMTRDITTPPRGQYRVLARVDGQGDVWSLGIGYAYGSITETPSTAGDYPGATGTSAGYEIVDLGTLTIPPVPVPENVTTGTFTLRVAAYESTATAASATLDLDWVMLVPIDFGSLYLSKTSGTDVIFSDSISDLRTAAILNTSDVLQSIPSTQGGDPPTIHPDGTRLYFIADDGAADIDHGWKMAVRIEPRFLSVAGT